MRQKIFLALLIFTSWQAIAQNSPSRDYTLRVQKTTAPIAVDGAPDEPAWASAQMIGDFTRNFPVDSGFASARTEIRLLFDDRFLYVSAICWQTRSEYTVQSLRRDYTPGTSDVLNVIIDPFKDGLNGFSFGVNPLNVQREGLIDNGNNTSFDWDNRWTSAVQNFDDRWTIEMAIPFKTLRYKVAGSENSWKINFVRARLNPWEVSTWRPVPRQFAPTGVAFTGDLIWDTPPPKPTVNVALIPYVAGSHAENFIRRPENLELIDRDDKNKSAIGGDAKIGVTPALNLDLTFNPDFSQVEVDRQVANLDRFELFFPERRQFFLENRDLFAMFGFPMTRPFFSRRIGLAFNPVTRTNQTVPIIAGARLSGKLTDNWRVGLLNMQTAKVDFDADRSLPAANFTVATLQRKVFERSAISGILVNKTNFLGPLSETQRSGLLPWNRVAGLEYNLYSKDNRWEGEAYYHRSFSPDPAKRGGTGATFLGYRDRFFNANLGYVRIDSTYTSDAGFVPRPGVQQFFPGIGTTIYPKSKYLNSLSFGTEGTLIYSLGGQPTDRDMSLYMSANFNDLAELRGGLFHNYTYLFTAFDPTNLGRPGEQPLPALRGYNYNGWFAEYFTGTTRNLQGNLDLAGGQFFNGQFLSGEGEVSYRIQPYGTVAMSFSYNRIRLPDPYASADLWLIGPRAEFSFSRSLFLSAFFQYNTQANNFNVNTRLQWRFAPVSDLFFVYTDNSYAENVPNTRVRFFTPKNRALVLKVVYWLAV